MAHAPVPGSGVVLTTIGRVCLAVFPRLQDHPQVRPRLDLIQSEFGGERQHGGLGRREVGLVPHDRLDLGEIAQLIDPVERHLDLVWRAGEVKRRAPLADRGDGRESQVFEEPEEGAEGVLAFLEGDLDLLAGLGGTGEPSVLCK